MADSSLPPCPGSSLSPGHQSQVWFAFPYLSLSIPSSPATLYQQIKAGEFLDFSGNGHWHCTRDLPHLWLHSEPVRSLVRVGGGWGEQPSEVLQAVRHFLFMLQAKPLGFEPEWPLLNFFWRQIYICGEQERVAHILVVVFSQGKQ